MSRVQAEPVSLTVDSRRRRAAKPRFLLTFLAWTSGLSGGDRHLLEVAGRWREHVEVAVIAPPQAFETIRSFLGDVAAHELGSAAAGHAALGPRLALEYVRRAVEASVRDLPTADVVVAASHFTPDAAGLARLVRRRTLGVAYVYHLIGGRSGLSPRTVWSKGDERLGLAVLRRFAGVVFVSNTPTSAALANRGFEPVHTALGLNLSALRQGSPESLPPHAAFVARMARTKGVTDAIKAWSLVLQAVPDARLRMVGTGPEREPAVAFAERLGISHSIEWCGFVAEPEKIRILRDSRLLLAPSYEEGWGMSVGEALASGVPVAAYRLPVLDELFGSAYLGATPGDVTRLAALAVRALTDDSFAAAHSRLGRQAAEQYDVDLVAEQELEVILSRWNVAAVT